MAKIFEVGDILPASLIAIYGEVEDEESVVITFNNNYIQLDRLSSYSFITDFPYSNKIGNSMIIDLSLVSPFDREVFGVNDYWGFIEWEEVISGFSITFEENGGTSVTDLTEQTALPTPLPTPTKENHSFLGWYYDSGFTNEAFADDPLTTDVTLYAKWELNTYTITYNSNGGTSVSQATGVTTLPSTLPTTTKAGYTFVAWYYESNFQTRAKAGDTIENNVTLYAKWHNLGSLFTEIADAIRSKDGTSENIRDVDFGERVKQIQGAIELTQAQYDALSVYDDNTYYLIVEE